MGSLVKSNENFMIGSTSLPPKNDGQLRGHVVVEIPFIKWIGKRPNPKVYVTVLWWGEEGSGTNFRPANSERQKVPNKFICAVYGMISGPKRFSKYLKDMKVMSLSIYNESDHSLVGHAQVKNLSSLSFSHPISSTCPVVDKQNKKIAGVKIKISITHLQSREGINDVPTPDGGLDPVGNYDLYLDDLRATHEAFESKSTRNVDTNSHSTDKYQIVNSTHGSNEGVMDSIVNSLERLRSEMGNSCMRLDVCGMDTNPTLLLSNNMGLPSTQPTDLILNSILNDGGGYRFPCDEKILEHGELFDLFYKDTPNHVEFNEPSDVKKRNKKSSDPQFSIKEKKELNINLPAKLKEELSEISGVLLLINNFTLTRQLTKDSKNEKSLSSDLLLSVHISRTCDDQSEQLMEIKPLLVKMKGKALQFNQRTVISNTQLDIKDEENNTTLQFKLLQGTSKMKVMCSGEFNILQLLLMRDGGKVMKLELKDRMEGSVGFLEVGLKTLFGGRERFDHHDNTPKPKRSELKKKEEKDDLSYLKDVPLYVWMVIPRGRLFVAFNKLKEYESVSLVVRSHWNESAKVKVKLIDGKERVSFNHFQTSSLSLNQSLLNAMKDNYVVIETWLMAEDKKKREQLLGISKLSINSFFQSFNNKDSFRSSINSTFPVVATDGDMPVVCPVSGNSGGLLQVLVAMGTYDQILHLQDFKMKSFPEFFNESICQPSSSPPHLERSNLMKSRQNEHALEIIIDSLKFSSFPTEMSHRGDDDNDLECFVQFVFPDIRNGACLMRQHRTSLTACGGNVKFHDSFKQFLVLPDNLPLSWHVCKAYTTNHLNNGIIFQLWLKSRASHDSGRLISKGSLSLNDLFRFVDSKVPGESRNSSEFFVDMSPVDVGQFVSGTLKVKVHHSTSMLKDDIIILKNENPHIEHASLSVHISRVCGLEHALQILQDLKHEAKLNPLNSFVKVSFSFLDQINTKTTRIVTKSSTPDFNTHFEFLVPMTTWNDSSMVEKYSHLFKIFEKACLEIDVYSTNQEKDEVDSSNSKNLLIGRVKIFLSSLLTKRTGLRGWFPIESPREETSLARRRNVENHVGGVEVAVKFSPQEELESILEVGRMDGRMNKWSIKHDDCPAIKNTVQLVVDNLIFHPRILSSNDITSVLNTAKCYIAYKFFDRSTIFSEMHPVSLWNGCLHVDIDHSRDFQVDLSSTFDWYLTEEKLEIQVWMTFSQSGMFEPRADDEFVGSGFVDLDQISRFDGKKLIVSGYCPLFNETSGYLGSSVLHYNLQISKQHGESITATTGDKLVEHFNEEDHFMARVGVERAYHVTTLLENRSQILPNAYVTFESLNSSEATNVVEADCDPVWNFESNVWLNKHLLYSDNMTFKVWHAVSGSSRDESKDRCFGFVAVNLSPLTTEKFQTISGFYNICDYDGSSQGQIKVSITPLQKISANSQPKNMMGEFKDGTGDHFIDSGDLVAKNITDALEELTNTLKNKLSQSYDVQSFPTSAEVFHLEDRNPRVERSLTPQNGERFNIRDDLEISQSVGNNSLHIYMQNSHEHFECDGESISRNTQDFEDNLDSTLRSLEDPIYAADVAAQGDNKILANNFVEKHAQTELSGPKIEEIVRTDLCSHPGTDEEGRLESCRSSPSLLTSDSDKKNILTGDWLSEHKRKVSQRIVAFKSFKVPSVEQSQRIARILANKFKELFNNGNIQLIKSVSTLLSFIQHFLF